MCQLAAATVPLYVVVFSLDTTAASAPESAPIIRPSQGDSGSHYLDRRRKKAPVAKGKRHAVPARLHRAMH
jgi:hypothetical protein